MKKYIGGGIILLMIATIAAWNVNFGTKNNGLSDISLVNIEILAYGENLPEVVISCGATSGICWEDDGNEVVHTPFGPFLVTACKFNGSQSVSCYPGLPVF
jgi:hypothetical protein